MASLPFDTAFMKLLAEHRQSPFTEVFQLASFMGEVEGYVLIVVAVYVAFDKSLAVRLGTIALLAMTLNHVLKIAIKNPRPFMADGTYLDHWAVGAERAAELATEYSTPSGHAMAAAAFYGYLFAHVKHRGVRIGAVCAIIVIGSSRPYIGVHYLEDILIGWPIGLGIAVAAVRYADEIAAWWSRVPLRGQAATCVAATVVLWAGTVALNGGHIDGQPRAFLGYAGLLTGILLAQPLELRRVNFDPASSGWLAKVLRYALTISLVLATLGALKAAFAAAAPEFSLAGYVLQYTRYTIAGVAGIYVAPWLFTKIRITSVRKCRSANPWQSRAL